MCHEYYDPRKLKTPCRLKKEELTPFEKNKYKENNGIYECPSLLKVDEDEIDINLTNIIYKTLRMRSEMGGLNITDIINYLNLSIEKKYISDIIDIIFIIDNKIQEEKRKLQEKRKEVKK